MLGMGASSRVKRDDRGITNYDIRSVGGESEKKKCFPQGGLDSDAESHESTRQERGSGSSGAR